MSALQWIALGKKLSHLYAEECLPLCRKYAVNQTCLDVLLFCANNPAHNTACELCTLRGLKSGIASVAIDSLIQNGLLLRTRDPQDRRKYRLIPTEQAAAVIAEGRAMQQRFASALKQDISEEEMAVLQSLTEKLEHNAARYGKEHGSVC